MAFTLSKALEIKPLDNIDTSIGKLYLFTVSLTNQSSILKELNSPIEKANPHDYVKRLFVFACYPENSLKDEKYKPENPAFTLEDINNLPEIELEKIAQAYVINNEYLFKKPELEEKTNLDNKSNHSESTDLIHPKEGDESYINYLHRLSYLEQKKRLDKIKSMLPPQPNLESFSKILSNGIANNLMLGDSLARSSEAIRSVQHEHTSFDWAEHHRNIAREHREPFDALARRLDELINSSAQASEFMVQANKIQTEIAAEIKSGGDATDRHAKKNIGLTYLVIGLTILGLFLAGWSNISGVSFSDQQQKTLHNYTSEFSASLELSRKTAQENSNESKLILTEILSSLTKLNENLDNNQKKFDEVAGEIDLLKLSNKNYRSEIKRLHRDIEQLKSEKKQPNPKP